MEEQESSNQKQASVQIKLNETEAQKTKSCLCVNACISEVTIKTSLTDPFKKRGGILCCTAQLPLHKCNLMSHLFFVKQISLTVIQKQ